MAPDLNVLLAASRVDHPQHRPAINWLEGAIERCEVGGSIELLPMVTAGFLRLATNPKLFASPMPIAAAVAFVDSLLAIPGVEMAELVNLRTVRKRASRQQADARASANRLAHGAPKHIREREAALREQAAQGLDQHRIERGDGQ